MKLIHDIRPPLESPFAFSIDAHSPKRCVFMRFKYCVSSLLCRQTIHEQRLLVCRRFYEVSRCSRKSLVKCFMMRVSSSRLFYKTHRCQRPSKLNFRLKLKAAIADGVPGTEQTAGGFMKFHKAPVSSELIHKIMLIRTCRFRWQWNYRCRGSFWKVRDPAFA